MFRRLLYSFQRFMYGRNGADSITRFLIWVYLAVWLIASVVTAFAKNYIVYSVFQLLLNAILVYMLFRMLSKNISKRRAECARFDAFMVRFRKKGYHGSYYQNGYYGNTAYNTYTEPKKDAMPKSTKEHKYVRCKNCNAVLRLKRRRGLHTATCPKCKSEVKVFSLT